MTGLDTNVVIRVLTRDDPIQAAQAAEVLRSGPVGVTKTVLVESEWVLRSAYGFERGAVNDGLRRFVGLENLEVEDRPAVVRALAWHAAGMDFADAVHLASSGDATSFTTFDEALGKAAEDVAATPSVRVLRRPRN